MFSEKMDSVGGERQQAAECLWELRGERNREAERNEGKEEKGGEGEILFRDFELFSLNKTYCMTVPPPTVAGIFFGQIFLPKLVQLGPVMPQKN